MKNRVYILALVFAAFFFGGCEKLDFPDEKKTETEQKGNDDKKDDDKKDDDKKDDDKKDNDKKDDGKEDDGKKDDGKEDDGNNENDGKADNGNEGNGGDNEDNGNGGDNDDNGNGEDNKGDDDNKPQPDGDGFYHGYYTIFEYMSHFGNFDCPVPFEDMLSGGCLYVEFVEKESNVLELDDMWVEGYVVGYVKSRSMGSTVFGAGSVATNIVIAESKGENNFEKCVPVQLSNSSKSNQETRAALNLNDNPNVLGKKVKIRGDIAKYMGVVGVKNAKGYEFE